MEIEQVAAVLHNCAIGNCGKCEYETKDFSTDECQAQLISKMAKEVEEIAKCTNATDADVR